jgi:type VII secretion protein EccB
VPSRRDQLFSYQFMVQRVVSAYVYRDAEAAKVPFPRALSTLFIGIMVAVLALAGVGVFGVLSPGGKNSWRGDKALIIEKETGARYVYLNKRLHPVLNYVSARLILKTARPNLVRVSQSSLRGTARGEPLGIQGVPDTLPDSKRLLKRRWTLCTRPAPTETGQQVPAAALYVGLSGSPGTQPGDRAMLVKQNQDNTVYLIWHNHRFPVRSPQFVLLALGLGQAPVVPVAPAWINAVPLGADIGPIAIDARGQPSALTGARIGQVLVAKSQSGAEQYYVVLADGIADITVAQADILLNDQATDAAYPGEQKRRIERTDLANARRSVRVLLPASGEDAPPARTPELIPVSDASPLCAAFDNASAPTITVDASLPAPGSGVMASARGQNATADEVVVPAGEGVLVEAMVSADAGSGTLAVITDLGVRYPLASRDVAGYLGYSDRNAVRMPAALVAMLREGPSLDPERAALPVGAS